MQITVERKSKWVGPPLEDAESEAEHSRDHHKIDGVLVMDPLHQFTRTGIHGGRGRNTVIDVDLIDRRKVRRRSVEELEALKGLQAARLEAVKQVVVRTKERSEVCYEEVEGRGYGERADSAKPSWSGQEEGAVRDSMKLAGKRWSDGGDGFMSRERTVVGARMGLASNESASRWGSKSRREFDDPDAITPEIFGNKRLKSQNASSEAEENGEACWYEGNINLNLSMQISKNTSLNDEVYDRPKVREADMSAEVAGSWQNIRKQCLTILEDLLSDEHAWAFEKPVLEIWPQLCDYTSTIQTPMDLGTVKSKLLNGEYFHPREFAADVRLTCTNAFTYNGKGSEYYNYARKMKTRFEAKFRHVGMKAGRGALDTIRMGGPRALDDGEEQRAVQNDVEEEDFKLRKIGQKSTSTQRRDNIPNPRLGRAASVGAYGGPRALTATEKEKLARIFVTLPEDRVRKVVEIMKRKNPGCLGSARDEIEVDLDNFDEETMFELYRLAMNWQKSKKKVLSRLQSSSEKEPLPTVTATSSSSSP